MRVSPRLPVGMLDDLQLLVDSLFHRHRDGDITVEVLARGLSLDELEERPIGWKDAMHDPDGLGWLRERLHK
jgi:hypothetical protein